MVRNNGLIRLIRLMLATWRVTSLLVNEPGPYRVFARLREGQRDNEVGKALECVWCTSVWVAIAIVILDRYCPTFIDMLAASTGAILIDKAAE
jgi:hypothetical protein